LTVLAIGGVITLSINLKEESVLIQYFLFLINYLIAHFGIDLIYQYQDSLAKYRANKNNWSKILYGEKLKKKRQEGNYKRRLYCCYTRRY
jgi:hypothetical protein